MGLVSAINTYKPTVDTRITNKTAVDSIQPIDEGGAIKDLADILASIVLFTTLVSPVITVAWTLAKADTTAYTPATSSSKNIIVDIGVVAAFSATFQYPTPGAGQGLPVAISGDFGTTDPGPGVASSPLVKTGIIANQTDTVTLTKPSTGLIVIGNQVADTTGNDTSADNISITFQNKEYFGTTTKDGTSQPILDSDILGLSSAFATIRARTLTNFGGGGTRELIVFPTSFGTPTFIVNGLNNTAYTKVRSNSAFVNAGGGTINVDVWLGNNIHNSPLASFQII